MGNEGRFRDQVEVNFWNKKSEWKVYSRHKHKKDKESIRGKEGKSWPESSDKDDWFGLEGQYNVPGQFSNNSTSENFELDKEALEVE